MKWKFVSCLLLLASLIMQSTPVAAGNGNTEITGSVPLIIYEVSTSNVDAQGVTVSWQTNCGATSQVFYDTVSHQDAGDYVYQTDEDATLVSAHSVVLTGLSPLTTYHYRVGSRIPGTGFASVSPDYAFTTSASSGGGGDDGGGGGGGGSSGGSTATGEKMSTNVKSVTSNSLILLEDVEAPSLDMKVTVFIAKGTYLRNKFDSFLFTINIETLFEPPSAPADTEVLGGVYDLGPSGARFDPAVILTMKYRDEWVPAGTFEEDLYIATWNEENQEWERVECTIDTGANTLSTLIGHFSMYTIMADVRPAIFTVSDLSISPEEITLGEEITVSALVTNDGDIAGIYGVSLAINDEIVDTQELSLAGGQSEMVTFTREIYEAGEFTVVINYLSGTFEVKVPETPESPVEPAETPTAETAPEETVPEPTEPVTEETIPPESAPDTETEPEPAEEQPASNIYWWLVGGTVTMVLIAAEVAWLMMRRRRATNTKAQ